MKSFFKIVTALSIFTTLPASALTLNELEACWSASRNQSGTVYQSNSDGSVFTGTFTLSSPGNMEIKYRGGGAAKISGQRYHVQDQNQWKEYPLGGMSQVFRPKANLRTGAVTHSQATSGGGIKIHLVDTSGRAKGGAWIEFGANCRMLAWEFSFEGNTGRTRFTHTR